MAFSYRPIIERIFRRRYNFNNIVFIFIKLFNRFEMKFLKRRGERERANDFAIMANDFNAKNMSSL